MATAFGTIDVVVEARKIGADLWPPIRYALLQINTKSQNEQLQHENQQLR